MRCEGERAASCFTRTDIDLCSYWRSSNYIMKNYIHWHKWICLNGSPLVCFWPSTRMKRHFVLHWGFFDSLNVKVVNHRQHLKLSFQTHQYTHTSMFTLNPSLKEPSRVSSRFCHQLWTLKLTWVAAVGKTALLSTEKHTDLFNFKNNHPVSTDHAFGIYIYNQYYL